MEEEGAHGGRSDPILPATERMGTTTAGQQVKQRERSEDSNLLGVLAHMCANGGC